MFSSKGEQASVVYIMDLSEMKYNISLYSLGTGHLINVADFIERHYVQLIKYIVAVNIPFFAYAIWKAMHPLLPAHIKERVRLLSPIHWRDEILQYADANLLPTFWNRNDEKRFTAIIDKPLRISKESYYKIKIPDGAEKIQIPPRQTAFVCRRAKKGDVINFWVHSDGTFASGIYCTQNEKEEDLEKMYPAYPCFAWIAGPFHVPLMQSFIAEKTGIYKFWYTNERAWFHTVTITVYLTVTDKPLYGE
uniref:CRAL-TRIO domain-containing protein n=1 Tax=Ascaris lumbricoides TaxID=6252 RepID=A0A0M3IGR1_ASCLU